MGVYNIDGNEISTSVDVDGFTRFSENLLDDKRITRPTSSNIGVSSMEAGYYINISGGHVAVNSNRNLHTVYYYDEGKELISTDSGVAGYSGGQIPSLIPTGAVYCRADWWNTTNTTTYPNVVGEDNAVTLYTSDCTYPRSDIRKEVLPNVMLNAAMTYGDLEYSDISKSEGILEVVRTMAVRAVNEARHAFRIGQFNAYGAGKGITNWDLIGKMLADYGVDICGFEESRYREGTGNAANVNLPQHLIARRPWQFKYGNTNVPDGSTDSPWSNRSMVSRFPVVESQEIAWNADSGQYDNKSFIRTKVKLPKYLDCTGGDQYLGFYVVHPSVTTSEKQSLEWAAVISAINNDDSAFKIVVSDTNDWFFDPSNGKMIHWEELKTGTGLVPVQDALSKTTSNPSPAHDSLDNIFVSPNITVLNYDIISGYDYLMPDGTYISDHDFVYADLQFDYSSIVTRMRPMTDIALIQNLTHVTSDADDNYHVACTNVSTSSAWKIALTNAVTVHLTAETGYTLSSVTVTVGNTDKTSSYYSNGTVTIPAGTEMAGDITITATATT